MVYNTKYIIVSHNAFTVIIQMLMSAQLKSLLLAMDWRHLPPLQRLVRFARRRNRSIPLDERLRRNQHWSRHRYQPRWHPLPKCDCLASPMRALQPRDAMPVYHLAYSPIGTPMHHHSPPTSWQRAAESSNLPGSSGVALQSHPKTLRPPVLSASAPASRSRIRLSRRNATRR
jgi:hypothetical protein